MELFAALFVLYALQCMVWLPAGAMLLCATLFGVRVSPGPGFRLASLRPGSLCPVSLRFPLVGHDGQLFARGATRWQARDADDEPLTLELLRQAQEHERQVRARKLALARGADAADAERIAALLRELAAAPPELRRKRIEETLRASLSLAGAQAACERVTHATRWLAATSDAYALNLLVVAPAAAFWIGSEFALRILAPALLVLHVVTLVCLARAHARLHPERRGERWQTLVGIAFYPPGLLRARHQLCAGALGPFHPAALAQVLLPERAARDLLRAELLRAEARVGEPAVGVLGVALERCELEALAALVAESGASRASLLATPPRGDALALAYCPACHCEYRRGDGDCSDCELTLERFPDLAR